MKKSIFSSICLVLGIVIIVTTGTTFAYLVASASSSEGSISGEITKLDVSLSLTEEYKATKKVPLKDNLVSSAIRYSNVCRDKDNYEVCSLYKLTLSNTGSSYNLNGYLKTTSTTYTTGNLKYQIYNTSYTAVSDIMTASLTTDEKVYFTINNNKLTTDIEKTNIVYYLVMWISDTGSLQSEDYSKSYSGVVGFETLSGDRIEADI